MFNISPFKISEVTKILNVTNPLLSRKFKDLEEPCVIRKNNRIVGLSPELVEQYLTEIGHGYLYRNFITLVSSQVGGVAKTSATLSLASCARRITSRKKAVIIIDCDSQGSATSQIFGEVARDDEPILLNYLEGRAGLEEVLYPVPSIDNYLENVFVLKSNLNNVYLEKTIQKPSEVKSYMLKLFHEVFKRFHEGCKIFIDTPPALSSATASAICGMSQLNIDSVVAIPLRSDSFSIKGAKISIKEKKEVLDTFNLKDIRSEVFFSMFDRRLKISSDIMRSALSDEIIKEYISPVVIRYSAEMTKSSFRNQNIFSDGKTNNATSDYLDLYLSLLGFQVKE